MECLEQPGLCYTEKSVWGEKKSHIKRRESSFPLVGREAGAGGQTCNPSNLQGEDHKFKASLQLTETLLSALTKAQACNSVVNHIPGPRFTCQKTFPQPEKCGIVTLFLCVCISLYSLNFAMCLWSSNNFTPIFGLPVFLYVFLVYCFGHLLSSSISYSMTFDLPVSLEMNIWGCSNFLLL